MVGEIPETEEDPQHWTQALDDVSGKFLDARGVAAARELEMDHAHMKKVWKKELRSEALREGYKVFGARWINADRGDVETPNYRRRLVANEFNTGQEGGLFASTPPLEALRWLLSEAVTVEMSSRTPGPMRDTKVPHGAARCFQVGSGGEGRVAFRCV